MSQPSITQSPIDDRSYRLVNLPNGLTCLCISDPKTEKSSACCDVHVGSMSDPAEMPGLCHFLEHMLFLGTEKYPVENDYAAFLNSHGGFSNAYTSQMNTVYYFDVQKDHLEKALDMFASFFTCPLFSATCTEREMNAVDSENSKNLQSDMWRQFQLLKSMANPMHPFNAFSTGNLKTLTYKPVEGELKDRTTRDVVIEFYQKHYSANIMKLVVYGKESLGELEKMVADKFSDVPNKSFIRDKFPSDPFDSSRLCKYLEVVPIKDMKKLDLVFPMPPTEEHYLSKPQRYMSHLIGHESAGSILSALKEKRWANGLSSYTDSQTDFAFFYCSIELTDEGVSHIAEITSCFFSYIGMLIREGAQQWVYEEMKDTAEMAFRFINKEEPSNYTVSLANGMHIYAPEHTLSGYHLQFECDMETSMALLSNITPSKCLLSVAHKSFSGKTSLKEKWYGTDYNERPFTTEELATWTNSLTQPLSEEWTGLIGLPLKNVFIPTDFDLKAKEGEEEPVLGEKPSLLLADEVEMTVIAVEDAGPEEEEEKKTAEDAAKGDKDEEEGGEQEDGEKEEGEAETSTSTTTMPLMPSKKLLLWHLQDKFWKVPKLNVKISLESWQASSTPLSVAMADLYAYILKESLNEYSYYADCAGVYYNVSLSKSGLELCFNGYHHKLPVLIEKTLKQASLLASDKSLCSETLFARMKEKVLQNYKNFLFWQPYYHCIVSSLTCLEDPRWTSVEKHAALEGACLADFQSFASTFLKSLRAETLVHGNATEAEAEELTKLTMSHLGNAALPSSQDRSKRMVTLQPGTQYVYRQHCKDHNPKEVNSAVENIYLIGELAGGGEDAPPVVTAKPSATDPSTTVYHWEAPGTSKIAIEAVSELLGHMMTEPAFDQLRTKEQLGYIVFTGLKRVGHHVGLHIIVQSNHKDPCDLDRRVETFLRTFRKELEECTAEKLQTFIQAVVEKLVEKPKNIDEETDRMWGEVKSNTYLFDRKARCASCLQTLPLSVDMLLSFYDRFIRGDKKHYNPHRRKISSQFYGSKFDVYRNSWTGKEAEGQEKTVVITDPAAFKRQMPLLPQRIHLME
jgi:insulysin